MASKHFTRWSQWMSWSRRSTCCSIQVLAKKISEHFFLRPSQKIFLVFFNPFLSAVKLLESAVIFTKRGKPGSREEENESTKTERDDYARDRTAVGLRGHFYKSQGYRLNTGFVTTTLTTKTTSTLLTTATIKIFFVLVSSQRNFSTCPKLFCLLLSPGFSFH